jgi:hypothetical protein
MSFLLVYTPRTKGGSKLHIFFESFQLGVRGLKFRNTQKAGQALKELRERFQRGRHPDQRRIDKSTTDQELEIEKEYLSEDWLRNSRSERLRRLLESVQEFRPAVEEGLCEAVAQKLQL